MYVICVRATALRRGPETPDDPKIALFRDWLIKSVTPGAKAPPPAG